MQTTMQRSEQTTSTYRQAGQPTGERAQESADITNHMPTARTSERSIAQSLQEYGRGVAGGLLFSLPLLYTMEMWWAGFSMHPWRLLTGLLVTLVLLLGYNRYAGLRRDASFTEVAIDSIEELGIGLLIAACFLWLTGRMTFAMPLAEIAGKIVIEALTVAIGVSVGTAQLGAVGQAAEAADEAGGMEGDADNISLFGQIILSCCGAVMIAGNVAPTEEIILLATEISATRLIGLALVSLGFSALILFYSDFRESQRITPNRGLLATLSSSVINYAVALVASAFILWFFGSFDGFDPPTWLAQTVVLGVAGALGASAGRLLLQTNADR